MRCRSEEDSWLKYGSFDIDGLGLQSSFSSSSSSSDLSENDSGASGTGSPYPWDTGRIADVMFGYCTDFFFFDKPFPTGGTMHK